jgi:hypothetical protein
MSLIATAADRMLGVIAPRVTAAAWSCPAGSHRAFCYCIGGHVYDACVSNVTGQQVKSCRYTVYTAACP